MPFLIEAGMTDRQSGHRQSKMCMAVARAAAAEAEPDICNKDEQWSLGGLSRQGHPSLFARPLVSRFIFFILILTIPQETQNS